jgi:hypothetical protein
MCEAFFATLECELLARRQFHTHGQTRQALFSFIEDWYNPHRRHSGIAYRSPIIYKQIHPEQSRTSPDSELSTAGQRRGRSRPPAGRPWTTRDVTSNGGNSPTQSSTA